MLSEAKNLKILCYLRRLRLTKKGSTYDQERTEGRAQAGDTYDGS